MIKAIFMDYTGTMVREDEPYTRELIKYFATHSNVHDPKEILGIVWSKVKEYESESFGDSFVGLEERTRRILSFCAENCGFTGDMDYMLEVWRKVWVCAPLFDDVKPFFNKCNLPIYVLSNDDTCFLEESMRIKDLSPAGIISAEMARACKPNKAIFEKALEVSGVEPGEVVHVGDSITSDVEPARAMGITPVYISRKAAAEVPGVRVIRSLDELTFPFRSILRIKGNN